MSNPKPDGIHKLRTRDKLFMGTVILAAITLCLTLPSNAAFLRQINAINAPTATVPAPTAIPLPTLTATPAFPTPVAVGPYLWRRHDDEMGVA